MVQLPSRDNVLRPKQCRETPITEGGCKKLNHTNQGHLQIHTELFSFLANCSSLVTNLTSKLRNLIHGCHTHCINIVQ